MNRLLLSYFHGPWINGLPSLENGLLSSMQNIVSFFFGKWAAFDHELLLSIDKWGVSSLKKKLLSFVYK